MESTKRGECSEATMLGWAGIDIYPLGRKHDTGRRLTPYFLVDEKLYSKGKVRTIKKVTIPNEEGIAWRSADIIYTYEEELGERDALPLFERRT